MKTRTMLLVGLMALPGAVLAAGTGNQAGERVHVQAKRLAESDRKVEAGRILLKWGGYVEKVEGQDRKAWAKSMWPSLAGADLDNLQKASRAVTYEGMRNALLGQRPYEDQIVDRMARSSTKASGVAAKALGSLAADLVFTPITPCRIVDTRVAGGRIATNITRDLDASNVGGNFTSQGGSNTNCGIPANPAALALSVTGLSTTSTGYLRVVPFTGTSAQGSPVPLNAINTTVTNDIIVPASQGATQELKIFSTANTHYAAFVTGYFMAPQATALNCVNAYDAVETVIPVDDYIYRDDSQITQCPSGYEGVSYIWRYTNGTGGLGVWSNAYGSELGLSHAKYNASGTDISAYLGRRCCRVPGR